MATKLIKIVCIITFLLSSVLSLMGQDSRVLYFMSNNPYSSFTNPAQNYKSKLYVGFPFISNMNISLFNSSIQYNKLLKKNSTGKTLTVDKFISSLKSLNWLNSSFSSELLGFGYRVDNLFISVSYKVRFEEYFTYPDIFFKLPIKGNISYLKTPAEIKNLALNATFYHELSLGFQYSLNENISIGVRPKLLMGLVNVNTHKSYFKFTTDPETYDISLQENLFVNASTIMNPDKMEVSDIPHNLFRNSGFALDIGASYKINELFGVNLSVVDAGFIKWITHPQNFSSQVANKGIHYKNGSFLFSGINIENLSFDTFNSISDFDSLSNNIQDTLLAYFPVNQTNNSYFTATYAKLFLSGYYNINEHNRISLLFRGDFVSKTILPSFTFAYSGNFFNFLDVYATYSIIGKTYTNVGLGVGVQAGPIHIYFASDNILAPILLLNAPMYNVQMGIFVNIVKKEKSNTK